MITKADGYKESFLSRGCVGAMMITMSLTIPVSAAEPDCRCSAAGQRIAQGEVFCIRPGSDKAYLARCDIVLNNTSWTILQEGCEDRPVSENQSSPSLPAVNAAYRSQV